MIIQGMSDGAYRGYHNLLMSQWQSEDGTLPCDDSTLSKLSGLFGRWAKFKEEVLEQFTMVDGRLVNKRQRSEWEKAATVSLKKGSPHKKTKDSGGTDSLPAQDSINPESFQSQDSIRTHARVSVNVSVPVVDLDLSVHSKILCETVGCFDMREQGALHQVLESYTRHSGKEPEQARDAMISRWKEWQAASDRLSWHWGSSYTFFMSGKWDKPEAWSWKEGQRPAPKGRFGKRGDE